MLSFRLSSSKWRETEKETAANLCICTGIHSVLSIDLHWWSKLNEGRKIVRHTHYNYIMQNSFNELSRKTRKLTKMRRRTYNPGSEGTISVLAWVLALKWCVATHTNVLHYNTGLMYWLERTRIIWSSRNETQINKMLRQYRYMHTRARKNHICAFEC